MYELKEIFDDNSGHKVETTKKGVGLTTIVAAVLAILKLCGIEGLQTVPWSAIIILWLSPLILFVALFVFFFVFICIFALISNLLS